MAQISAIKVSEDRAHLLAHTVNDLADSIKNIGLLNPPTVTENMTLIAGAHRIAACKQLGWKDIEVNVVSLDGLLAELAEIDENLIRNNDLHYLKHGEKLARRKEIYEALHPETKWGGDRKSENIKVRIPHYDPPSFVQDTAQKTGVSSRVIHEEIQMAKNLTPEAKEAIVENDIPKSEAIKVARMEPEEQHPKIVDLAQARKTASENALKRDLNEIDRHFDNLKAFRKAITNTALYGLLDREDEIFPSVIEADENFSDTIKDIDDYIMILSVIKNKLILLKGDGHEQG